MESERRKLPMSRPRPVIDDTHLLVSGNVVIHPTATIAADVLLQADPDCQLVIAAGACIGTGSVVHAHRGQLMIESGAILGNGVLIVGHGTIGAGACIGSMSTIIDSSIAANEFVPPDSLIGDRSRQVDLSTVDSSESSNSSNSTRSTVNPAASPAANAANPANPAPSTFVPPDRSSANPTVTPTVPPAVGSTFVPPPSPTVPPIGSAYTPPSNPPTTPRGTTYTPPVASPSSHPPLPNNPFSDPSERNFARTNGAVPSATTPGVNGATPPPSSNSSSAPATAITPPEPPSHKTITQVYGQAYLQRIMGTMFPHRKLFNPPQQNPGDPNSPTE